MRLSSSLVLLSLTVSAAAATFMAEPVVVLDNGTAAASALSKELSARKVQHQVMAAAKALAAKPGSRAVWVAASASECRAEDTAAVLAHLRSGGGFLVLGDMPFQKTLYQWVTVGSPKAPTLRRSSGRSPFCEFSTTPISQFIRSTSAPEVESRLEAQPALIPAATGNERRTVAHVVIPKLTGWTTFGLRLAQDQPADAATSFWARGTGETRQLALEWDEQDGSRWIAKIDLTPEWQLLRAQARGLSLLLRLAHKDPGPSRRPAAYGKRHGLRGGAGLHSYRPGQRAARILAQRRMPVATQSPSISQRSPQSRRSMAFSRPPWATRSALPNWSERVLSQWRHPELPMPSSAWSTYWRPMGSGFDKGRRLRFIPVVTALNADGSRAGTLAQLTLQFKGQFPGAVYGSVSIPDQALLFSKPWMDLTCRDAPANATALLLPGGRKLGLYL